MTDLLHLSAHQLMALAAITFCAGLVRGFSGFALSALVMSTAVIFLPPVQLIPMLWFLEMAASVVMFKGGLADADRSTATGLIIGSGIGLPIGLSLTLSIPEQTSKGIALGLLIVLAALQLSRVKMPFLATRSGLYGSGIGAGIITGLSGAGGMFIALYMLARNLPARVMRGSMSIYLMGAGLIGLTTHLLIGTMDQIATVRGLALIPPTLLGIFAGRALFTPRFEPFYKPVCLTLLIGLATIGLIRIA
ncbi:sulfite exporter TauE/SafE family protein [Flavimaricola marinus]|uniref:Probable membrane transporter protein n=1 Tax=Flavimaricola marinus TaxID=1819565 RepID=A0A238LAY1_9RHOB|nr:sulfite exporter TauE/SafE family protein [Flavimaricola marinus]SMY06703.1 Sulfite exporter TauE/SafE [Flavimaricola marinus]